MLGCEPIEGYVGGAWPKLWLYLSCEWLCHGGKVDEATNGNEPSSGHNAPCRTAMDCTKQALDEAEGGESAQQLDGEPEAALQEDGND